MEGFLKKLFLLLCGVIAFVGANAQIITAEDIEQVVEKTYGVQPKTGKEYMSLADQLLSEYPLDMNRQLTFTTVIEAPKKSKDELFTLLNGWFVASFNSGKEVIQMSDKEAGVILAKGYLSGVGSRVGFSKSVNVGEYIVIRLDIKDEKIRVISSIQEYYMETSAGVGQMLFGGAVLRDIKFPVHKGYPFDAKSFKQYRREAAIGYVGGIVYSKILQEKIRKAINFGITGNESDNW